MHFIIIICAPLQGYSIQISTVMPLPPIDHLMVSFSTFVSAPHALPLAPVPGPRLSKVDAKLVKDGKPLSVPKDVEVSVQEKCVVYTIKKPSRDQTGKFTIRMTNAAGTSTKDVNINMQDKPSPPTNLDVSLLYGLDFVSFGECRNT